MKKWLVIMEITDDGKDGTEDQELPVYMLDSRKSVSRYLLRRMNLDSGILLDFIVVEELIP